MIFSVRNWVCAGVISACFHATMGWSIAPSKVVDHVARSSGQQVSVAGELASYMSSPKTLKVEPEKVTNNAVDEIVPEKAEPAKPITPPETVQAISETRPKPIEIKQQAPAKVEPQKPIKQRVAKLVPEALAQKITPDTTPDATPDKVLEQTPTVTPPNQAAPVKPITQELPKPVELAPTPALRPKVEDIQPLETAEPARLIAQPIEIEPAPVEQTAKTKIIPLLVKKPKKPIIEPKKIPESKPLEPVRVKDISAPIPQEIVAVSQLKPVEMKDVPKPEPKKVQKINLLEPLPLKVMPKLEPEPELKKVQKITPIAPVPLLKTAKLDVTKEVVSKPITPPKPLEKIKPTRIEPKKDKTKIKPIPTPRKKAKKRKKRKKKRRRKKKKGSNRQSVASLAGVRGSKTKKNRRAVRAGDGGRSSSKLSGRAAFSDYQGRVQIKLRRYQRSIRRSRNARGKVVVIFTVHRSGRVSGIRVRRSSGNPKLDKAALSTVRRASPLPKFPAALRRKSLTMRVPFRFQ